MTLDLDAYFKRITEAVEEGVNNATVKAAFVYEGAFKKAAPTDTGNLKRNFYTSVDKPNYESRVCNRTNYLDYVLYGTGIYNTNGGGRTTPWVYNVTDTRSKYYGWHYTKGQKPNNFIANVLSDAAVRAKVEKVILKEVRISISKI